MEAVSYMIDPFDELWEERKAQIKADKIYKSENEEEEKGEE